MSEQNPPPPDQMQQNQAAGTEAAAPQAPISQAPAQEPSTSPPQQPKTQEEAEAPLTTPPPAAAAEQPADTQPASQQQAEGQEEKKELEEGKSQKHEFPDVIDVEPAAVGDSFLDESKEQESKQATSRGAEDTRTIWVQKKLEQNFTKFEQAQMWKDHHQDYTRSFLNSQTQKDLFFWIDQKSLLQVSNLQPPMFYDQDIDTQDYQVIYLIKKAIDVPITQENIDHIIISGLVDGDPLDDLLSKMNSKYLNAFLNQQSWPDGVKKQFVDRLHKFMATITEASHLAKNTTTLYIPQQDLSDPAAAIKDRDLIHRLQSTVIHWTRQIKEIVINQDSQQDRENLSPLDEIKHWRTRTFNLSFIHQQLEKPQLKRIIEVLELNDSSNLRNFKNLAKMIKKGSQEANDNLRFLSKLQDPCQKLEAVQPRQIPKILPQILNCVRIIFELSSYYNTQDRIRGLLTKISNQIIKRCRETINIDDIHDGDVEKVMNDLDESIKCGLQWRQIYEKSQYQISKYSDFKEKWDIGDKKSVFAQVQAFVQRCKDLKDICLGQLQFSRKGSRIQLPHFGGSKGPQIAANLYQLQRSFKKHLEKIRRVNYDILDVLKMSKWHQDFADFNNNVKDLQVMFMNIISLAFNSVSTVEDAVQMIDNFDQLSKRQAIKDFVQTKAAQRVFNMFLQEATMIETMNSEQKKKPPYPISHPKYAGNALYTKCLLCRLEQAKQAIDQLWFIDDSKMRKQVNDKYTKVHTSLDQYITMHLFGAWKDQISGMDPQNVQTRLQQPVLLRAGVSTGNLNIDPEQGMINPLLTKSQEGGLQSNFDKSLLRLIIEVQYWSKLQSSGVVIPHQVHQILQNKEKLRVLRQNVMLVVRDYNSILDSLGKMQRPIFRQNMQELDAQIEPGTKRYRWNSSNVAENFVRKCRADCAVMAKSIARFKSNHNDIMEEFRRVSETDLIEIAKKKIYILKDFLEEQGHHRKKKKKDFQLGFNVVKIKIMDSYNLFLECKMEVQIEWLRYIQLLDLEMYEALLKSVSNSFLILSRAIRGDQKTDPITLFKVYTIIDPSKNTWNVIHDPTHSELLEGINEVMTKMNFVTDHIPRLQRVFREDRQVLIEKILQERKKEQQDESNMFGMPKPGRRGGAGGGPSAGTGGFLDYNQGNGQDQSSLHDHYKLPGTYKEGRAFHQKIAQDKDLLKRRQLIQHGVNHVEQRLKQDVAKWKSHQTRQLFNLSTKKGKQRTMLQKIESTTSDIMTRYQQTLDLVMEQMSTVHREPTPTNEQFIQIDSSKLKQKLIDLGQQFLIDLMQQLHEEVMDDIKNMYEEFDRTIKQLNTTPNGLQDLKQNMALYDKMKQNIPQFEANIKPIKAKFEFLQQQEESNITQEEQRLLKELPAAFEQFKTDLAEVNNNVIMRWQRTFRQEVQTQLEDFKRAITQLKKNFSQQAPYHALEGLTNQKARAILDEFKDITKGNREHEQEMKLGLDIFNIGHPTYMDLSFVEKELLQLGTVWTLKEDWDAQWDEWKVQSFRVVEKQVMDQAAKKFQERMKTFPRQCKNWDIFQSVKMTVEKFRRTMPLIEDLRRDAMRKRHWEELQREVGGVFDPFSDSFTLEQLFKLKLTNHVDFIIMLADRAQNQYDLEVKLKKIETNWEQIELKVIQRENKNGQTYHTVEPTDEVTQTLDDDVKRLSTIKTSPYYAQFEGEIQEWEVTLANISDTLDLLMTVQRNWSHLESIFNLQDDMSFQLPNQASIFAGVNKAFIQQMERINKDKNARRGLTHQGFNDTLVDLNKRLEHIQRSLEQFLKSKRILFPRFYFISNDDLLQMLGQSKDISAVQKHVKKCFEGIDSLQAVKRNKQFEVIKVRSGEKEQITLMKPLIVEQGVEVWLRKLQERVEETLKVLLKNALVSRTSRNEKKEKMLREHSGQLLITAGQIVWTQQVQKTLTDIQNGSQNSYKQLKVQWKRHVTSLIGQVRNISGVERHKLIALITIEVHNRDIIDKLASLNVTSPKHFQWMQQLRFEKREENDQVIVIVKQTNTQFPYGYEYQGNNGRLVVTALTDRCYMTLTNALFLFRGGAPQGPAGTGKTETVKDLGKNMARFVVVFNCSENMNYKSLGHMFSGLAQSGAWGCFDEFNRIEIEVLSVVAQQISTILDAVRQEKDSFNFEGDLIGLNLMVGIFITMNPGYAGRTELPDNLKSLFRPVSMMVPDFVKIAQIMLMGEGFQTFEDLSKKVVSIYNLMKKQLSKQDHYDFGMRAVKSVLTCAGRIKRERGGDLDEQQIVMKAVRDMNLPKFVGDDVPLFDALFNDLFKGSELPQNDNYELLQAIEEEMTERKLQLNEYMLNKVLQLLDSLDLRHGNMLVGNTLSGKSTCWKILKGALNRLHQQQLERLKPPPGYSLAEMQHNQVRLQILNPKSIGIDQLFGSYDIAGQWHDGILSRQLKKATMDASFDQKWLLLDGPVDTLWIESMNSVLDDNKVLTLNNGDRIALNDTIRILFEVENLSVASPATVSRAGMIYLDIQQLGWNPYVEQWINNKQNIDEEYREFLGELFQKYVTKVLTVKQFKCKELQKTSEFNLIRSLCTLFDALATKQNGVVKLDEGTVAAQAQSGERTGPPGGAAGQQFFTLVQKWFAFCVVWSIGASVDEDSRRQIDFILRDIESIFPHSNTVFQYFVSPDKNDWVAWQERIQGNFRPQGETPFHKILIPTIDTARNRYITQALIKSRQQVCLLGQTGVGKTALVQGMLYSLNVDYFTLTLNFSAGTSAKKTQDIIESKFEKRTKDKLYPPHSKKAICFIDDLNMPRRDMYGSQPPLQLLRQWYDYGGWYDLQKLMFKHILDLQLISSMGPPGGARDNISQRLLSKFHLLTVTIPIDSQIERIFSTLAMLKFSDFDQQIKMISSNLAKATLALFKIVQEKFLPIPVKSHYLFNMRDMSKVFQGLYRADKNFYQSKASMVKLWSHEMLRVFHDRLNDQKDRMDFHTYLQEQVQIFFQLSYVQDIQENKGFDPIFVDFLNENMEVYEEVSDQEALRNYLNIKLNDYNNEPRAIRMDLVLFKDAIKYTSSIYRLLKLERGNVLLVGVGGSGRHSLTKLAAYMAEMKTLKVEVTKSFDLKSFREFLKTLYTTTGTNNKTGVFLFSDNDIVQESFLEDVNNILSSGEVPNLYDADELQAIRESLRKDFKVLMPGAVDSPDAIYDFFLNRVRANLHIAICMSPIGQNFRDYVRMYPALINNATVNWFMKWPDDALKEVAQKFVERCDQIPEPQKKSIAEIISYTHSTVEIAARQMKEELKRIYYVTPTHYIELMKGYEKILSDKSIEIGNQIDKLRTGLNKLQDARKQVEQMTAESEIKKAQMSKKQKICSDLIAKIEKEDKLADQKQKFIEQETLKIEKERKECQHVAWQAEQELKKAEPALIAAGEALEKLDKKFIAEVKTYASPPAQVAMVMFAVMIILGKEPSWPAAKKELSDTNFIQRIMYYEKEKVSNKQLRQIEKYTKEQNFKPQIINNVSAAAGALCLWVRSIEDYAKALREVQPKREKRDYAIENLKKKEQALQELLDQLNALNAQIALLKDQQTKVNEEMRLYKQEIQGLQIRIDRGEKLITGLGGEKTRWQASLQQYDENFQKLTGNCLISASFMSYCGPFPSQHRQQLLSMWMSQVRAFKVPHTTKFDITQFLVNGAIVREWNTQGLPTDNFSIQNGVMVTKGLRWPLMIDPQNQANQWVQKMEDPDNRKKLLIADYKGRDFLRILQNGIYQGKAVLMPDLGEEIDPAIDAVLNKSTRKTMKGLVIKIGDKQIQYNSKFRLYLFTRMSNPHYTPEISTKICLINFTVKESGLEEQLLGIVVKHEEPTLERNKAEFVVKIAKSKKQLIELEDQILRKLQESQVSLLEDEDLVRTLQISKQTSDEVKQSLEIAEQTMKKIDIARQSYRPCGNKASILFFVLYDLNKIDPMYQFSLEWYIDLFVSSILSSKESPSMDPTDARIKSILKFHTFAVFRNACRSLFERHKLLLSLQMCAKLRISQGQIDVNQWNFFLYGGQGFRLPGDKDPMPNPQQRWISNISWDNILKLEHVLKETFQGIPGAISHNPKEWYRWYMSPQPENQPLPGQWQTKCEDKLRKMVVLRCLRRDRVTFAARAFVQSKMGAKFVDNKPFSISQVFNDSKATTPVIFILSPGVDPLDPLVAHARQLEQRIQTVSLGQGQSQRACALLYDGANQGFWVYLANCHLSVSWLPQLQSIIDSVIKKNPNSNFRLFLSSNPHPKFPISILQRSIKMTTQPPKGIGSNMIRLYQTLQDQHFLSVMDKARYRRIVFGLCWYHAILVERKKFKQLGWNVRYDFNDSDFSVCEDLIAYYLGRSSKDKPVEVVKQMPWQAVQYLIADANYGGRVTDDLDRRLLKVYAGEIFNDSLLIERWKPPIPQEFGYIYPDESSVKQPPQVPTDYNPFGQQFFVDHISKFPAADLPQAFGQHVNAEISSQIQDTSDLLSAIISLQPRQSSSSQQSQESAVLIKIEDLLQQIPGEVDIHQVKEKDPYDSNPLKVVLLQELQRYNSLLSVVTITLNSLKRGIKGQVVISPDFEIIMEKLSLNEVPKQWLFAYQSLKSLSSWVKDLNDRYTFFVDWAFKQLPTVFWISAFTYPTGFTTGLLQKTSRRTGESIDNLHIDYLFTNNMDGKISEHAKEGAYVRGLFLQGARWNADKNCLMESEVMNLQAKLPVLQFKPVAKPKKGHGGDMKKYSCPCYYYPIRAGSIDRDSFMFSIDMKTGDHPVEFWIKRGTAVLMQLAE